MMRSHAIGRDATREFEDVGHSGDAREQLETLVIGTVRPSSDEELRISREGGGGGGKQSFAMSTRDSALAWTQDNMATIKKYGTIGVAGATVLGFALFMQRYISSRR